MQVSRSLPAAAHGVALCFLSCSQSQCSPSVNQGQASKSVYSRERHISTVSVCTKLKKKKRLNVCFGRPGCLAAALYDSVVTFVKFSITSRNHVLRVSSNLCTCYSPAPDVTRALLDFLTNSAFIGILIFTILVFDLVIQGESCQLSSMLSHGCCSK